MRVGTDNTTERLSTRVDIALHGVRMDAPVRSPEGAGPSDDGHVLVDGANAALPRNPDSPYRLQDGRIFLGELDTGLSPQLVTRPRFYDLVTADGVPYEQIARLHGADVLATTVVQTCIRYAEDQRCRFCTIEESLRSGATIAAKTPAQLAEVAQAAVQLDGIRQMAMTTGTTAGPDRGARNLVRCVRAVLEAVPGLPIQVQIEPRAGRCLRPGPDVQAIAVAYRSTNGLGEVLLGQLARQPDFHIELAADPATRAAYYALRTHVFVHQQELFTDHDHDDRDDDPRTLVLVAQDREGTVLGDVRLGPVDDGPDLGWWFGVRLVVDPGCPVRGVGAALVRAACAHAESAGVLRFEATVQARHEVLFHRLGWTSVRPVTVAGTPHVLMRWPIDRIAALVAATKRELGPLLAGLARCEFGLGGAGYLGDDGAPVPGSDLVAACDAILPSMVERDPEWAGWCSVLVNVNDLAAMGAAPVGLLDALGARDASFASRVLAGLRHASQAYDVPVLGSHTQLGVPAALSVTALGRAAHPVRGGGGRPGHRIRLTVDIADAAGWRPGYGGRQRDSTSHRRTPELRAMLSTVATARPAAAKDVSMAGIAGTLGMLAEASGCRAVLDVAAVPRPAAATVGDWLTCFPGFGMLTADEPGRPPLPAAPGTAAAASFDRDLEADFGRIEQLIGSAQADGVRLLSLPEAALGGYLVNLDGRAGAPPALTPDGPEIRRLSQLAGDMVVAVGYCEDGGDRLYNSAICVTGDGVLGHQVLGQHPKVHQPLREDASYGAGDRFAAFDIPVGRLGMMICYDKAFPESARTLALDGAGIVLCLSAWPASATNPAPDLAQDRWKRRFDLFDRARALENQIVWLSANQSGQFGSLQFAASAKIVDPGGEILADTGVAAGLAVAELDIQAALETARRSMAHLRDRQPGAYAGPSGDRLPISAR